ncbi:ATP-binding protein [Streptomyces sp. NPDC087270]|uniref:ATP-binding protein n=1 Tax=Streptomyces sp. NPDC087270 TaxID=3365774 RepID=UPI00381EE181
MVQARNVTGDIHFHPAAAGEPSHPVPRQLPADEPAFVNRTGEVGQLNAILSARDGGQVVVSVHVVAGTAGAGKTSLVLHWAHQVKHRFPEGQLFVNLRGYDPGEPLTPGQALRRFLRALGVASADIPQDTDDAAALYRSLLADRRVLIILDNAATVAQVRPLLPGGGRCLIIVTSRSRLSGLAVRDGAHRLTLGTLPEREAVALLGAVTSGYRPDDDPAKLAELARLCAHLPLALRIAAERAASHPHLRLDDLIADLRDESALWDTLSTGSESEADAVRTVFAWSYRALPEPAARLFRLLGLHPGPEFGLHPAAVLGELPLRRARQSLDDLVGAHLLEQTGPDRYQFHDLLRAYAADQAHTQEPPEQRDRALRRVLEWYLHTADAAGAWIRPAEARMTLAAPATTVPPLECADFNAAVDWSEREHATLRRLVLASASAELDALAWQLAIAQWNALPPSASYSDWIDAGRAGLEAAERSNESDAQIRLLTLLGTSYRQVNRLGESLDCHERALALARARHARVDEARSLNLIGLIHLRTRRLDVAEAHFQQAAAAFNEQDEPRRAAIALSNLARIRLEAGRLPEAARATRRALAAHRALNNQQSIGNILNISAALHLEQSEPDQARQAIDEALDIALALRDRTLEAYWLLTLGDIQRTAGEYGDALVSYQRSAMLHRRVGDRSREALAWRGTGRTYRATGRADEAAEFHRRAAAVHAELGDTWQHAVELGELAAAVEADTPEAARAHWSEALRRLESFSDPRAAALRTRIQQRLTV